MRASRTISGAIARGVLCGLVCAVVMSLIVKLADWRENGPYLIVGATLCGGALGVGLAYPRPESDL
ncbi:MAG: hypothetical protein HS108_05455 [Planctomycetes bacterium]|jgi:hypothetical protein|nr:hypothetical protein [Planctomycetota bacterium]MCL4732078.1 hypothetical protein [Planctomycetota bacterium]